jgi:hypothetical protein
MKLTLESTSKIVELMPSAPREVKITNVLQRKAECKEGITLTPSEVDTVVRLLGDTAMAVRIWEGKTESGIAVHAFITRVAVHKAEDCAQFERELQETRPPSAEIAQVYPLRMVL